MKKTIILASICLFMIARAETPACLAPTMKPMGKSSYSVLLWDIYAISLWSDTIPFSTTNTFALRLEYFVDGPQSDFIRYTQEELERFLPDKYKGRATQEFLRKIFPKTVHKGDTMTLLFAKNKMTVYINDVCHYTSQEKAFITALFRIWLDKDTNYSDIREDLLTPPVV